MVGKYEPAGINYKGEGVLTQEEIAALGGPLVLMHFAVNQEWFLLMVSVMGCAKGFKPEQKSRKGYGSGSTLKTSNHR